MVSIYVLSITAPYLTTTAMEGNITRDFDIKLDRNQNKVQLIDWYCSLVFKEQHIPYK